jgi:uncharacterized C2H2 Zn-finger protein
MSSVLQPETRGRRKVYTQEELQELLKEHRSRYYEVNKEKVRVPAACPHCEKVFRDKTSLTRHVEKSLRCLLYRAKKKLEEYEKECINTIIETN